MSAREIAAWLMGFISGLGFGLILGSAFPSHASHVNERADQLQNVLQGKGVSNGKTEVACE